MSSSSAARVRRGRADGRPPRRAETVGRRSRPERCDPASVRRPRSDAHRPARDRRGRVPPVVGRRAHGAARAGRRARAARRVHGCHGHERNERPERNVRGARRRRWPHLVVPAVAGVGELRGRRRGETGIGTGGRRHRRDDRRQPPARRPAREQGDARVDLIRRGRRAVRARLGRGELVRHHERDLLDAQPQGIRGPAQARAGVPGARPPDGPIASRCRGRERHSPVATRTLGPAPPTSRSPRRAPLPRARLRPSRPTRRPRGGSRRLVEPPIRPLAHRPPQALGTAGRHDANPSVAAPPPPDLGRAFAEIVRAITDVQYGGWRGRVVRAIIGWLPIALGLGWLIGELTGCGRFAATCDGSADPIDARAPAGRARPAAR